MILLDTHIWLWWVHDAPQLSDAHRNVLSEHESTGLGVSVMSCWEVAKLVERGRVELPSPISVWIDEALSYPGIRVVDFTPRIALESTQLPGEFHRDPADQIIVATARIHDCPLVTEDGLIRRYPHVKLLPQP